jgi:hypothetical protein
MLKKNRKILIAFGITLVLFWTLICLSAHNELVRAVSAIVLFPFAPLQMVFEHFSSLNDATLSLPINDEITSSFFFLLCVIGQTVVYYCLYNLNELESSINIENRGKLYVNPLMKDEKLSRAYKLFNEIHDKREDIIINNIYNYSEEHQYNQAILFIGAEHRVSMIKKTEKYNEREKIKLNWKFYGS